MNLRMYILAVFAAFSFLSCNSSSSENQQENKLTATINGKEWQFFEVDASRGDEGIEITGLGYLEGDRGAIPVHLTIKVVDVPPAGEITTPYKAYFSPNTQEDAALATIRPEDQPETYDTQLDSNALGTFTITEATDKQLSGEFKFVATDKSGRTLEVENGRFSKLSL